MKPVNRIPSTETISPEYVSQLNRLSHVGCSRFSEAPASSASLANYHFLGFEQLPEIEISEEFPNGLTSNDLGGGGNAWIRHSVDAIGDTLTNIMWRASEFAFVCKHIGSSSLTYYPVFRERASFDDKWVKLYEELDTISGYEYGWDGYKAPAPSCLTVRRASSFLGLMQTESRIPTRVEASVIGGIGITCRDGARKAYVEFQNNGLVSILFADDDKREMRTRAVEDSLGDFSLAIKEIEEFLNG